jgi:hypothetical protein
MRLAGAEIHQVGALRAQFGGLGGHSHGCGNLNPANAVGKDLGRSGNCHSTSIFTDLAQFHPKRIEKSSTRRSRVNPHPLNLALKLSAALAKSREGG